MINLDKWVYKLVTLSIICVLFFTACQRVEVLDNQSYNNEKESVEFVDFYVGYTRIKNIENTLTPDSLTVKHWKENHEMQTFVKKNLEQTPLYIFKKETEISK